MNKTLLMMVLQAIFALAYSITPLSEHPFFSFDALVIVYGFWVMYYAGKVGLGTAWCLGIFKDVLAGTLLGEHALALTLVAYLMLKLSKRMTFFSYWQQAVGIGALVLVNKLTLALIEGLQGQFGTLTLLIYPSFMSALLWVLMCYVLLKTDAYHSLSSSTVSIKRF